MRYEVKIKKEIVADNGVIIREGSEVAFDVVRRFSSGTDHYLGEVKKIVGNTKIVLDKVEINNVRVTAEIVVLLCDIVDNSCSYVSLD